MAGADLVAVGYARSKLKDTSHPPAEVDRRVQVVGMEGKTTASRQPLARDIRDCALAQNAPLKLRGACFFQGIFGPPGFDEPEAGRGCPPDPIGLIRR